MEQHQGRNDQPEAQELQQRPQEVAILVALLVVLFSVQNVLEFFGAVAEDDGVFFFFNSCAAGGWMGRWQQRRG